MGPTKAQIGLGFIENGAKIVSRRHLAIFLNLYVLLRTFVLYMAIEADYKDTILSPDATHPSVMC